MRSTLLTVVSVLALTLVACGGGDEAADGGGGGDNGGASTGGNGGGTAVASSPAGTYMIEKSEAWRKKVIESMTPKGAEMPPEVLETAKAQLDGMLVKLVLKDDGSFSVEGKMGDDAFNASGTWTVEGKKLTVTTTHEDGEKQDEPDVKEFVYENGQILIPADTGMPFEMTLKRR